MPVCPNCKEVIGFVRMRGCERYLTGTKLAVDAPAIPHDLIIDKAEYLITTNPRSAEAEFDSGTNILAMLDAWIDSSLQVFVQHKNCKTAKKKPRAKRKKKGKT